MKLVALSVGSALGATLHSGLAAQQNSVADIVRQLEGMLSATQKDVREDRTAWGKKKCHCDTTRARHEDAIEQAKTDIAKYTASIDEHRAKNAKLSIQKAQAEQSKQQSIDDLKAATQLRNTNNQEYKDNKADFIEYGKQLDSAVETLAAVGGDQSETNARDNDSYMADDKTKEAKKFLGQDSLLSLRNNLSVALGAAASFLSKEQHRTLTSFLQGPGFAGTYSSQSGEVVGILKNMRDTFADNLTNLEAEELRQLTLYNTYKTQQLKLQGELTMEITGCSKDLKKNSETITTDMSDRVSAETTKETNETDLDILNTGCTKDEETYNTSQALRADEISALSEAIKILNSDDSFDTIQSAEAMSLVQLRSSKKNHYRDIVARKLQRIAGRYHSLALAHIAAKIRSGATPFDTVITKMEDLIEVLNADDKQDKKDSEFYASEWKDNTIYKKKKEGEKTQLDADIVQKNKDIGESERTIDSTKLSIQGNLDDQKEMNDDRLEAKNTNIHELNMCHKSRSILKMAVERLRVFYARKEADTMNALGVKSTLLQRADTPVGKHVAHKDKDGLGVIGLLEAVSTTQNENIENVLQDEESQQATFQKDMTELRGELQRLRNVLSDTQGTLAQQKSDLEELEETLESTEAQIKKTKDYLDSIESQTNYWKDNFQTRQTLRIKERDELKNAIKDLQGSNVFVKAAHKAKLEELGKCADVCDDDAAAPLPKLKKDDAACEACKRSVTVAALCVSEPNLVGCSSAEQVVSLES